MPSSRESRFATGEVFEGHGYRDNKHGFDYQESQFIRFALRAMNNVQGPFELASDMRAGDKWDDIVYRWPKPEGEGRLLRLVQVKNVRDTDKKITIDQLLSDSAKEPFSLPKYFKSYLNIKKNESSAILQRSNDTIEDCILLMNIGFANELRMEIENDLGRDLLFPNTVFRFKSDFISRNALILGMKTGIVVMPYEFSRCLNDRKPYHCKLRSCDSWENQLYIRYWHTLKSEVLNGRGDKFLEEFIRDRNLSPAAKHFREELYCKYQGKDGNKSQASFLEYLRNQTIEPPKVSYSERENTKDHGSNSDGHDVNNNYLDNRAENLADLDSEAREFLSKLKFVLNQPCETKELAMKEMALSFSSADDDPMIEYIYCKLRLKVSDWMSEKSANFLKRADLEKFFRECRGDLIGRMDTSLFQSSGFRNTLMVINFITVVIGVMHLDISLLELPPVQLMSYLLRRMLKVNTEYLWFEWM